MVLYLSSSEEYKPKRIEVLLCLLLFALWTIPAVFIDNPEIKVLGIPLLWFYYILLSILTSLLITLMYFLGER
jgi:hypothetical protein